MTQVSTETAPQEKRKATGRPFTSRTARKAARRRAAARAAEPRDIKQWATDLISHPRVRASIERKAKRGELSAPLLKNLMERAAGIVKAEAREQGPTQFQRSVQETAALYRKNLTPQEAADLYRLIRKGETGRDVPSGRDRPDPRKKAEGDQRPAVGPEAEPQPEVAAQEEAAPEAQPEAQVREEPRRPEPVRKVVDVAPAARPRDRREEEEWRRHLIRCSDPRSCRDGAESHPSHAWRRLTRLP